MRRAFTLVELLVVIAILAVIAAILFPVFGQSREKARQSTCSSNLKQYALATQMYLHDYDERFPPLDTPLSDCIGNYEWSLSSYIKSPQLAQCPSEPKAIDNALVFAGGCSGAPPFSSYVANTSVLQAEVSYTLGQEPPEPTTNPLSVVSRPAETILFYEGNLAEGPEGRLVQARHQNHLVAAFVDGHVKAIPATLQPNTTRQHTLNGPGKPLKVYKVGIGGGFYAGQTEIRGIP